MPLPAILGAIIGGGGGAAAGAAGAASGIMDKAKGVLEKAPGVGKIAGGMGGALTGYAEAKKDDGEQKSTSEKTENMLNTISNIGGAIKGDEVDTHTVKLPEVIPDQSFGKDASEQNSGGGISRNPYETSDEEFKENIQPSFDDIRDLVSKMRGR